MPEPLQEIIDLFKSPDEHVRARGIERMALEGGGRAVPWLLIAMKEENLRLRNKAKSLILQKDPGEILPYLDAALRDNADAGKRNAAMEIYANLAEYSVPALTRLVFDPDEEVRNFVCVLLGVIGSADAVPALLEALVDRDLNVSHAAAEALGKIGDQRAVGPLIDALGSSDFWRAFPIINALGELRDERAVTPLLKLMGNDLLILNVTQALGRIACPTALPHVLPLLSSEEPAIKAQALQTAVAIQESIISEDVARRSGVEADPRLIEAIGSQDFRAYLVSLLSGPDQSVKKDALSALGWLREGRATARMVELLKDEALAQAALDSLVSIGTAALPDVMNNLDHPVGVVRHALVTYLGSLGPELGAPHLRKMLSDDMSIVRAQAALTLGKLGDVGAADGLIKTLGDENPEVQEAAITALASLDPQVVCRKLIPCLKNSNPQFMFLAAETLGLLRREEAVKPLSALLDNPRDIIREVAVKSIGRIGGDRAASPLLMCLKDDSPRVRQQAIISLGGIKDPLVLKRLIALLKDQDRAVRYYAIRALKDQGSPLASPALVGVLEEGGKNLLIAAVETLGSLGDPSACDAIITLTGRADTDLLRTAAQALGDLRCSAAAPRLLELATHGHWSVRSAAASSLGKVGGGGAFETLSTLVAEKDQVVQKAAVAALGELGDRRAARILVPLLHDEDVGKTAYEAVLALGPEAGAEVLEALRCASVPLLLKGVRLLGHLCDPRNADFLQGALMHEEPAVRREAAIALGRIGHAGAVEKLRRVETCDEEDMVRTAASEAVKRISEESALH